MLHLLWFLDRERAIMERKRVITERERVITEKERAITKREKVTAEREKQLQRGRVSTGEEREHHDKRRE